MDFSKIFLKDACPTSIGGQAVLDGVMMKGPDRLAVTVRRPDGRLHIRTTPLKKTNKLRRIPVLRGVFVFVDSLITGMSTIMYSADVLADADDEEEEKGKFELWIEEKFGEKAAWNFLMYAAVIFAIAVSIGVFILLPTAAVSLLGAITENHVILNLAEGILRMLLFVLYIWAISKVSDIKVTFQYHGAEHKTIHCYEKGLELTPENAQQFYTLHPRCGTSFLMFVMVISLILFSLLGWPNLAVRLLSRILLIPVVAGLSYELLRWAGRSDNWLVRILSVPGLWLQKITTNEPTKEQLEVAIASMKAVLVPEGTPFIEGICDCDANLIEEHVVGEKDDCIETGGEQR